MRKTHRPYHAPKIYRAESFIAMRHRTVPKNISTYQWENGLVATLRYRKAGDWTYSRESRLFFEKMRAAELRETAEIQAK